MPSMNYFISQAENFVFVLFLYVLSSPNWCNLHARGGKEEWIYQKLVSLRQQNHIAGATTAILRALLRLFTDFD